MKTITLHQHLMRPQTFAHSFLLALSSFFLVVPAVAQKRATDIIVTTSKDSLFVKIKEVGPTELTYRKIEGDTTLTWTIAAHEVQMVLFGNGDTQRFGRAAHVDVGGVEIRYYKVPPKTDYGMKIANWSTDRLLSERRSLGQKYIPQKAGGLASFAVGGGFVVYGFLGILVSVFTFSDEVRGGKAFATGAGVSTAIAMPLTILGIKNRRKYKAIEAELRSRGI